MSRVHSAIRPQFDSLPADLQAEILTRKAELNNMSELMAVLEQIVAEG